MYKLGVTGGIGSGKTTAAKYIKSKFNATLFNADEEAKKHLQSSTPLQNKVINTFGGEVTSESRKLDFRKLAEVAFSTKENQQLLNGLIWPEVRLLVENAMSEVEDNSDLFIVDAPLIIEANMTAAYDSVLLISAPEDIRFMRALARGTLSMEQIEARAKLQYHDERKRKAADYIIDNTGSLEYLYFQLDQFYEQLQRKVSD
tara:strand:+ start:1951 stop:2556 length:606 start_codon:yes stop_codon:yes gene_type:complete